MSLNFKVDENKCIHCGLCVKDCMPKIITFNENKIPTTIEEREKSCTKCQHCLSICPVGAISIFNKNPEDSEPVTNNFNSDEILRLIKERKSIRHYKRENVSADVIEKLKKMIDYVPTGVNNHGLHFSVIDNVEVMDKLREIVNSTIIKIVSNKTIKSVAKSYERYTNAILNGEDIIFRGAPHLVVVSTSKKAPCKDVDPIIALSYFELYAKSLGLGTCWCGLAYYALKFVPQLGKMLDIPYTHEIAYVMLFGYPEVEYKRTTQPVEVPFKEVTALKEIKPTLFESIKGLFKKS